MPGEPTAPDPDLAPDLGEPDPTVEPPRLGPVRELERLEASLVRAELAHPGTVAPRDVRRLRYLLGFARLTNFQPGAAGHGRVPGRAEVNVGPGLEAFRTRVLEALLPALRVETDRPKRLRRAVAVLEQLAAPLAAERQSAIDRLAGRCSAAELDAEAGHRVLVNIGGGGGGAGYVYIGAHQALEEAGIVPSYVIGSSFGALMGIFRARDPVGPWAEYIALAHGLDRRLLLSPARSPRRFGLPGLLRLKLAEQIGGYFINDDGSRLRIRDLAIPYEAVVAGVRRRSFERLPKSYTEAPPPGELREPEARYSPLKLGPAVVKRLWQVAAFVDPRVVKPIVLGADELTLDLPAVDAAGFSCAIPGVLHYDIDPEDTAVGDILRALFQREDLAALIDGGVVSNVPAELAWRRVHTGLIGTRSAFYLAFDCFHPQWDPKHLWLQPITQAVQLQMTRNAPFADWIVRFEPTLSPVNIVPHPDYVDKAIAWGRASIEPLLPMIKRFLEPVAYEE